MLVLFKLRVICTIYCIHYMFYNYSGFAVYVAICIVTLHISNYYNIMYYVHCMYVHNTENPFHIVLQTLHFCVDA